MRIKVQLTIVVDAKLDAGAIKRKQHEKLNVIVNQNVDVKLRNQDQSEELDAIKLFFK